MKRRDLLKSLAALPGAALVAPGSSAEESEPQAARVRRYRQVGRTDLRISDISFGAGQLPAASLVLRALERGVNYFDTAPDYGQSEVYLGEAVAKFKQRDKLYLASKFCDATPFKAGSSHLQAGKTKQEYKDAIEGSLKRLRTDYLDVAFVHAMGELEDLERERGRLTDQQMLAAAAELKQEGKIRYLAVSSHGPYHMELLMGEAIRSGHFDLVMPAFNFMKFPKVPDLLQEAQARGVGVIAMKTLAGARDMSLDAKGGQFEQAAFKWVLKHPEVAGLVVTMKKVGDLDLYLPASGQDLGAGDQRLLDRYAARYGQDYCRTGCSTCEASCPAGVSIAAILRYQMYFEQYGDEKRAMQSYAALGTSAAVCAGCAVPACNSGCPHGLPVAAKLQAAHGSLSFAAHA